MFKSIYVFIIIALGSLFLTPIWQPAAYAQDELERQFPLSPGAYWVYEGTVKWSVGTEVHEADMTWKMEVIDVVSRGDITGYHMRGHPSDLSWYEEGEQPSEYVIVQVGPNRYYRAETDVLDRLRDESDQLLGLVSDYKLFLDVPLVPGKRFCDVEHITLSDGWYCWNVWGSTPVDLSHVSGVDFSQPVDEYTIAFRTNPDHVFVKFVPGLGITQYTYVHHGTVSEADMRLIEYHPGTDP